VEAQRLKPAALVFAAVLCAVAALAEAVAAGRGIRARFQELVFPRYSIPLAIWPIVGVLYYVMCFIVAYRLFDRGDGAARDTALALLVAVMGLNAAWNYFFFRARSVGRSFLISVPYSFLAVVLFAVVWRVDRVAAIPVAIYLAYLVYANLWGYKLWRLN
jgi:tryptophan-rich sensory protein